MATGTGQKAEQIAADYLSQQGWSVLSRNWRTRWCEIDIVATKGQIVYFIEVKYRKSTAWGNGLDYITPAKLRQMHFAATMWVHAKAWQGDYRLSAVEVSGAQFTVTQMLESL